MGSGNYERIMNYKLIQSRYYRAPEVVLEVKPFTVAVDMWSVGCIVYEILIY